MLACAGLPRRYPAPCAGPSRRPGAPRAPWWEASRPRGRRSVAPSTRRGSRSAAAAPAPRCLRGPRSSSTPSQCASSRPSRWKLSPPGAARHGMQPRAASTGGFYAAFGDSLALSKAARPRSRCHVESYRSPKTPRPRAAARGRRRGGRRVCALPARASESVSELEPQSLVRAKAIRTHVNARYRRLSGRQLAVTEVTSMGVVESVSLAIDPIEPLHVVPADSGIYFALLRAGEVPIPARSAAWPAARSGLGARRSSSRSGCSRGRPRTSSSWRFRRDRRPGSSSSGLTSPPKSERRCATSSPPIRASRTLGFERSSID